MEKRPTAWLTMTLAVTAVMTAVMGACRDKEMFSEADYQQLVLGEFPVDTVDNTHDWNLLRTLRVGVTADVEADNVAMAQILNANPYQTEHAEVLAEKYAAQGERVWMTIDIPANTTTLWAAVVTRSGRYYVKPFTTQEDDISFSSGNIISQGTLHQPIRQTFTYIYETSFPMPTDFDYNDIVMRLSMQVPSANMLQVSVTLNAVGTTQSVAAALRLPGIAYDQVEQVTISEGTTMDSGYPLMRQMLKSNNVCISSLDGEAVINLFEDAHWVLSPQMSMTGNVVHQYLNTNIDEQQGSSNVPEQTRTYIIRLKDDVDATYFTLADFDPFVIASYNGIFFEIHQHRYKFSEVLWQYYGSYPQAYNDHLAWAVMIPSASFNYPVEGAPLGTYHNGVVAGVYSRYGHSFGQWVNNHRVASDWWQYPNYGYYQ